VRPNNGAQVLEFLKHYGAVQTAVLICFLEPHFSSICDLFEKSEKPVVCAIEGYALGAGLEVAISTHYRLADASAV